MEMLRNHNCAYGLVRGQFSVRSNTLPGSHTLTGSAHNNLAQDLESFLEEVARVETRDRSDDTYFVRLFISEINSALQAKKRSPMYSAVAQLAAFIDYSPHPTNIARVVKKVS